MTERAAQKLGLVLAGFMIVAMPVVFCRAGTPQRSNEAPAFEVVSIKPHPHGYWPTFSRRRFTPDGFIWTNTFIEDLIVFAYDLHDPALRAGPRGGLIPGGPKWIATDWYDFDARMSESDITKLSKLSVEQQEAVKRRMLQSMLADRFKLRVHLETKEAPAYMLVLAKNGPKNMKRAPDDAVTSLSGPPDDPQYHAAPISFFILMLENLGPQYLVIDKTGLGGKYDFTLQFARDAESLPRGPDGSIIPDDSSNPSIYAALQEQLGLKLVLTKAPLQEMVIDYIERPSAN